MVRLFNEGVVRFESTKQLSGASGDSIKDLNADGKVRAVDQRAVVLSHQASHLRHARLPTGCAYHQRNTGASASFGVPGDRVSDGKIDRHITGAQRIGEILDAAIGSFNVEPEDDLVALLARQLADQLPHGAISD